MKGGHPDDVPLTREERNAIAAFKRLAKRWPAGLWLFSAAGELCVMRRDENGEQVMRPGIGRGVDPDYHVDTIGIPNDGGDW